MAVYWVKAVNSKVAVSSASELTELMRSFLEPGSRDNRSFMANYARRILNERGTIISSRSPEDFISHLISIGEISRIDGIMDDPASSANRSPGRY